MTRPESRPERYPKHRPAAGSRMIVDGVDLGQAMLPQDVLIWLRVAYHLDDDEIVPALLAGADRVERDMADPAAERPILAELPEDERREAVRAAREVTRSRVDAWRRRHRHMTWVGRAARVVRGAERAGMTLDAGDAPEIQGRPHAMARATRGMHDTCPAACRTLKAADPGPDVARALAVVDRAIVAFESDTEQ